MTNPVVFFSLFNCFMKVDQIYSALAPLRLTLDLTENKPDHKELYGHALEEYKKLVKLIKREPAEEKQAS